MLKEYHQIDLETGIILDVCLFNDEIVGKDGTVTKIPIPEDYKEGWTERMFSPVYDLDNDCWKESKPLEEILQEQRILKDRELNDACQEAILAGFKHTINGIEYEFSYDKEAQGNFSDAQSILSDGLIAELLWTVKQDGEYTRIPINKTIMDELKLVILLHKTSNISKYRDKLMPLVESASSVEEVEAVIWM